MALLNSTNRVCNENENAMCPHLGDQLFLGSKNPVSFTRVYVCVCVYLRVQLLFGSLSPSLPLCLASEVTIAMTKSLIK